MGYSGIMRVEKRGRAAVYGVQIEANRTEEDHENGRDFADSDIDWERTHLNTHLVKTDRWNEAITKRLKEEGIKPRKDSIVLLDALYTASPEYFEGKTQEEILDYFQECLDFHVKMYCQGDKSRVINAVVHFDEKTPHMAVASIPLMEDEQGMHLSAKVIMGNRKDYRLRQDRFYEEVTKKRGLERGEVQDPAETKRHTTKREWQKATQEAELERLRTENQSLKGENDYLKAENKEMAQEYARFSNGINKERLKAKKEAEEEAKAIIAKAEEKARKIENKDDFTKGYEEGVKDTKAQINEKLKNLVPVEKYNKALDDLSNMTQLYNEKNIRLGEVEAELDNIKGIERD